MALFNTAGTAGVPPSVYEVPGKIYIFGQAHDAETLTPIFGDFLRGVQSNTMGIGGNWRPMVSLTHRSIAPLNRATNYSPDDRARSISNTKVPLYSSLSLPNGDYLTVGASAGQPSAITKFNSDGEIKAAVAMTESTFGTELAFFHEDEINVYAVGSRSSANINYNSGNRYVACINKTTLGVTTVSYGSLTTAYGSHGNTFHQTPLHKDVDGSVFVVNMVVTSTATQSKGFTVTKITKGGIVSNSVNATNLEFTGSSIANGNLTSSNPVFLHEDEGYIYFAINSIQSTVSATSTSNKFLFIAKIDKTTLVITRAQTADAVATTSDDTNIANFASLFTGFFTTTSATYDIRELRRTEDHVFLMMTLVKGGVNSMSSTMVGTSFSLVLQVNLKDFGDQQIVEFFPHRANVGCSGVLPINQDNDQFMITYDGAGADFVQYSHASNKFSKRDQLEFPLASAMVDQMGRIWAQDGITTSLHLFSPTLSSSIRVGFADRNLKYNGIPVESNIAVSAFNHSGERVANNVTLTLEGNAATFSDGSKTYTAMTSSSGDVMIPYTLISNGYVRVTAVVAV